jgi:serine/threonine protein kinase
MMKCAVCGHNNAADARTCASCGAALGLSATGTPISGTPGVMTGHTGAGAAGSAGYSAHLPKGVRLQGDKYAVGEVLGQGGFGITYKGGDLSLRCYVAIKEFFPPGCVRQGSTVTPSGTLSAADYAGVKAKFIEEARTLARFSDPGIVRVFGVFEENNTAYMVMEFLEGETLSNRITNKGTLEESEVVDIAEKVGNALSVVHATGLIHRDIKPDNICLTNSGRVVLIDFGTARAFASNKTVRQTTLLTPGYAPLEQYGQEARFGAYSDIYALCATLYQCLTGQVPPQATDRATGVELKAPHVLNPRVSQAVSKALVWGMQVKATERPQSVKAFLATLKQAGPGGPTSGGTMLVTPTSPSSAVEWGGATSPSQAPPLAPGVSYASIQVVSENQILTNASPQDVLSAVERAFQAFGIPNPTVDSPAYRVLGTSSPALGSSGQSILAQVTRDARGTLITISGNAAAGGSDYARGRDEIRRLIAEVQNALQTLPAEPPSYAPTPYQQPAYQQPAYPQPGYASPTPYPQGGYRSPVQPTVSKQGGWILALGICSVFCCCIPGPIPWIMGNNALAAYGDYDPGDRNSVIAGRVLGIIGTVLWGLYFSGIFISNL